MFCGSVWGVSMQGAFVSRKERKKKAARSNDVLETAERIAGERSNAAYCGNNIYNADPLYMLTTSFTNTFDAIGKDNAKKLAGNTDEKQQSENKADGEQEKKGKKDNPSLDELHKKHDSPEYVHSTKELNNGEFADRFSSYAFRGGKLAASVMAGQGKQMFTVCLSRAIGRPYPQGELQKKVKGQSAVNMTVPSSDASVRFNRNAYSAVGIVTDAMKSAGKILEIFRKLAVESRQGTQDPLELRDIGTLGSALPFFDTESDKKLIVQYKERLKQLEGDSDSKSDGMAKLLQSAITKQTAILNKKRQEQRDFLTMIDRITSNLNEAEKLFKSDGFVEQALKDAEELSDELPPDDDKNRRNAAQSVAEAVADFFNGMRGDEDVGTDDPNFAGETDTADREETDSRSD